MDRFARQIEALTRKITQLRQQTAAGTTPPPVLLEQALGQLQDSIEELHTAQEELLQQHAELQDTREQVEAERQSYHELFDYAPDAYLVTDLSGMIRAANRAAAQMCGLDQRRLFGKP